MTYQAILLAICGAGVMAAGETRVAMKDVPQPVQATIGQQTKGARLRGIHRETEDGKTYYEAETTVNGKSRDVLIDSGGTVVEIEEAVALGEIPEAARAAIRKMATPGQLLKVESVTKGSVVSYEATIRRKGKTSEVAVHADGSAGKVD